MRTAASSSAQEDRHDPMAPIQRPPYKNVGSVYDNRSVTKNDKQRDTLQFGSAVDTSTRSDMVNSPKNSIPFEPLVMSVFFQNKGSTSCSAFFSVRCLW